MKQIETLIATGSGDDMNFVEVYATQEWLEKHKLNDARTAQAIVLGKAYNLLEIYTRVRGRKETPVSVRFTHKAPTNINPLIPGMEILSATSNWCCICNDADPPECACVPC